MTKGLINVEIATLWLAIWPPRSRSGWKAVLKATASSADAVDARSCVAPWWLDSGWLSGQLAWLESDSQSHRAHWASEGPWTCSQAHAQGQPLTARCCPPVHTRCALVVHDWFIIGLWPGSRTFCETKREVRQARPDPRIVQRLVKQNEDLGKHVLTLGLRRY